MRAPRLPNAPNRRLIREPDDEPHLPTREPQALRAAILDAIAAGPLQKWELRERLHEPERWILRMLRDLRDDGLVKRIGHVRQAQYALRNWNGDRRTVKPPPLPGPRKGQEPPSDSWWLNRDREAFSKQLREQEAPRMAGMQSEKQTRGVTVGWGDQS